jgi:hypothetical protein
MIVRLELPIARQHEAKLKAEEEQKPAPQFVSDDFGGDDIGSVFDLKLLRCPRLVAPTLVTLP